MPASVSDLLARHPRNTGGTRCQTCLALGKVKGSNLAEILAAIDDRAYSAATLAAVLSEVSGSTVSKSSMENHRRDQHRRD